MNPDRLAAYPFVPAATPPPAVVGGEGSHLHLADGRRILDGGGGAIVANIGHGRPEIARAAADALSGGAYTVPLWATEYRVGLVERLRADWLAPSQGRCLFTTGGSEAVEAAIRVARQHHAAQGDTDRWKIIGRAVSYHGATLGTLSVANHDRRRTGLEPLLLDLPKASNDDIEQVRKLIEQEDPATVAAILVEPVSGASGAGLTPPDDYLPGLRALCDEYGILLVADEVMTAFGRTGRRFGVDHWDVVPDLLVGGKGLGGGYVPIGAVFATDRVVEPLAATGATVMYHTFSGADVTCAVADQVLAILTDEDLVARADRQGAVLRRLLHEAFDDHPHVADIRGLGLQQGLHLVADRETGDGFGGALTLPVIEEALERGCWIYPAGSGPVEDALLFGPPFIITDDELERLVAVCAEAIDAAVARVGSRAGS